MQGQEIKLKQIDGFRIIGVDFSATNGTVTPVYEIIDDSYREGEKVYLLSYDWIQFKYNVTEILFDPNEDWQMEALENHMIQKDKEVANKMADKFNSVFNAIRNGMVD